MATSDRQNPHATVAFICPYIFFASAFESILAHLPDAEIVPDFTAIPAGKAYPEEKKKRYRDFLTKSGLPWRDMERSGLAPKEFFSKYGTLTAPFSGGWLEHPVTQDHRKVHLFYGGAKDVWVFGIWNLFFDISCTPGPYYTERLNHMYGNMGSTAFSTGEYKLDAFSSLSQKAAQEVLGLSGDRRVVLAAPTWGSLSSMGQMTAALIRLSSTYDVVLKVHHMTDVFSPETVDVFRGTNIRLIYEDAPIAVALAASDVVISDASGALFDAVLTRKPVVVFDSFGTDPSSYIETPFHGSREGKLAGVATSGESLDQRIKRPDFQIGPVITGAQDAADRTLLARTIESTLQKERIYEKTRNSLLDTHFIPLDGLAGKRAAEHIQLLSRVPASEVLEAKRARVAEPLLRDFMKRLREAGRSNVEAKYTELQKETERYQLIRALPPVARLQALINEFF